MEGVPRMPMLEIELKPNSFDYSSLEWTGMPSEDIHEATQQQITEGLKKHIKEEYGDDPDKYNDAIEKFIELQSAAYKALLLIDFDGCNTLKKYYGQLHYMQSRFPFSGDDAIKATFTWQDAFTGILTVHESFTFEQTAILFNIGAFHSSLGAMDNRTTEEGIRISCVHFQCAAGLFSYIADHFDTTLSPDISQFMLKLFINVMLAQGQECLLEKSMQDNRKHSIVSKISQQVVDYYKQCLQSLENKDCKDTLGSHAHQHWKRIISFKVAYYSAITKYYMGNNSLDQDKYGQAVAFFGASVGHLNETTKLAKNLQKDTRLKVDEALKFTSDVLNGKYNSSVKDNNFVYHDKVPDASVLPEVKGASLVKALPFEPANESLTGPDIFAKLVPMEAHLAASTYSEEKAKLLRSVVEKIVEKDEVLNQYKQSIELNPNKLINYTETSKLDQTLIEKCAQLSVDQSPITKLQQAMQDLSEVYSDLDSILDDILALAENEETEDLKFQDVAGKDAFSTSEDVEGIKKELTVYKEIHHKATQMNDDLHTACRIHINNMKLIAGGMDSLKGELNLTNIADLLSEEDKNVVELIRKLCDKVVEMEVQRKNLLQELRQQMESDDVTSTLVTKHGVDQEDLFKEELKKHDSHIDTINKNLSAQDNILDAVTEANARYTKIRKTVDTEKERVDQKVGNLVLSCEVFDEVLHKCKEGEKFFAEVFTKAKQLHERAKEFCGENEEKRSKIYKKIEEKEKAKRPPPRPSAPKPKLSSKKPTSIPNPQISGPTITSGVDMPPVVPGITLSPDILAKMMAEDEDEFLNDPEFLQFLQNQGDFSSIDLASSLPATATSSYTAMPGLGHNRPHTMPPPAPIQQQPSYPAISSPSLHPGIHPAALPPRPPSHHTPPPTQSYYPRPSHGQSPQSLPQNIPDPRQSPGPAHTMAYQPHSQQIQLSQSGLPYMSSTPAYSVHNTAASLPMQYQSVASGSPVPPHLSRSVTPMSQPMSPMPQNLQPMTQQNMTMPYYNAVMPQNVASIPQSIVATPQSISNMSQSMSAMPQSMSRMVVHSPQSMAPMPQTVAPQVVHNNYYASQQQPPVQQAQPPPVQVSQVAIVYSAPPCHQSANSQPAFSRSGSVVVPPIVSLLQPPPDASQSQLQGQPYYVMQGNSPVPSIASSTTMPTTPQVIAMQRIGPEQVQNIPVVSGNQQGQPQPYQGQIYPNQAPTPPISTTRQYSIDQQFSSPHPLPSATPPQQQRAMSPAPQTQYMSNQLGLNNQQNFMPPSSTMQQPPSVSRLPQNMVLPMVSTMQQQRFISPTVSQQAQMQPQPTNVQNQIFSSPLPNQPSQFSGPRQMLPSQPTQNQAIPHSGYSNLQQQQNYGLPNQQISQTGSGLPSNQPYQAGMVQPAQGGGMVQPHGSQSYQQVPSQQQSIQQPNQNGVPNQNLQSWNQSMVPTSQTSQSIGQSVVPAGQGMTSTGQSFVPSGQSMQSISPHQQMGDPQVHRVQPHISSSMPQLHGPMSQAGGTIPQQQQAIRPQAPQQQPQFGQLPQFAMQQAQNQMPQQNVMPRSSSGIVPPNAMPPQATMIEQLGQNQMPQQNVMPQSSSGGMIPQNMMSHFSSGMIPQNSTAPQQGTRIQQHSQNQMSQQKLMPQSSSGMVPQNATPSQGQMIQQQGQNQMLRQNVMPQSQSEMVSQNSMSQVTTIQQRGQNQMPQFQSGMAPQNATPPQHGTMVQQQGQNQMPRQNIMPPSQSGVVSQNVMTSQQQGQNQMPQQNTKPYIQGQQSYSQSNMQSQQSNLAPQGRVNSDSVGLPVPNPQENYTFKSHPHAGQYFSTPSNENSPKHVPAQRSRQSSVDEPAHPGPGILAPTPVNEPKPTPPLPRQPSSDLAGLILTPTRTHSSSADELLFTSPDQGSVPVKANNQVVLVPTKIDEESDKMVVRPVEGLPYMDDADLMKFKGQVVEFRSKVGNLLHKPESNGLCALDREWKQLSEAQEKFSRQLSTAIARCSSYKNRFQDIVPFDQSRIILKQAKDDYINASVIDGVSPYCPRYIATQSPLANTASDFWLMVYEQQITLIVMLVNAKDVPKKCPIYWPEDRSVPQQHGPLTVSFTNRKTHGDLYIERKFTVKHKNLSLAMSVTQLQYIAWPEHRLPSSASDLLSFLTVVQNYHSQQRNLQWPILVHCESGVGRTGVFCAFLAGINEINAGMGIVNVVDILTKMRQKRKYMVQEKAQLKFVYDVILYHAIDVLKQRKVFLGEEVKLVSAPQQVHQRPANPAQTSGQFDIFSNQSALSSIQATVEKMTIKPGPEKMEGNNFAPPNFNSKSCSDIPSSQDGYVQYENQVRPNTSEIFIPYQAPQPVNEFGYQDQNPSQNVMGSLSDLVQGTMTAPVQPEPPLVKADSAPIQTVTSKPDIVESCNSQVDFEISKAPHDENNPSSHVTLIESLNPESFTLNSEDEEVHRKRKVTKDDFFKTNSGLASEKDPADPLSGLDPLWTLRK
ncbi:uncharacterized protein LOC120332825 [Styela clava]